MSLHDMFSAIAGNEDADLGNVLPTEATVEALVEAQVDAELAETATDIAEAEKDIERNETAIEAVEERVEELEEQIDGLESMLDGKRAFNAELFHHQLQRATKIANSFGGDQVQVLGAESYADVSTAELEARAGLLSFKEKAVAAGSAIKKFFVDLYNGFISFVVGIFNRYKAIASKADALEKKVEAKEKFEGKVKLPKSSGWLKADGTGPDMPALLKKVLADADAVAGGNFSKAQSAVEAIKSAGASSPLKDGSGFKSFKVQVGLGTVTISVPTDVENLGKANIAVGGVSGEAKEIDSRTKEQLKGLISKTKKDAEEMQAAKLDKKALESKRDATIAKLEASQKTMGVNNAKNIAAARAGTTAVLKVQRGVLKFGETILMAQLGYVAAHV